MEGEATADNDYGDNNTNQLQVRGPVPDAETPKNVDTTPISRRSSRQRSTPKEYLDFSIGKDFNQLFNSRKNTSPKE